MVTHLEPDILECEVKRDLGSITKNKVSGGDGIPAELLKILKDDAVKVLHSISSVWFGRSVMSDSLWPHGLQHARLPCPSPALRACSNSCPPVGNAIQPSHPLLSPSPPAFNLSQRQGLLHSESVLHIRWPKDWSFSFSINPSNELHMLALHMSANLENSALATGPEKVSFHSNHK